MSTDLKSLPARPPRQARSQRTLAALLDALDRLLRERSFDSITVLELAQEAGVSTGAFYARFHSKEDLLPALYARFQEQLQQDSERRLEPGDFSELDPDQRLELVADRICRAYEERRWLLRAMSIHSRQRHPVDAPAMTRETAAHSAQMTWLRRLADCLLAAPNPWSQLTRAQVELSLYVATTLAREAILFPHLPMATALGIDGEFMRHLLPTILQRQLGPPDRAR